MITAQTEVQSAQTNLDSKSDILPRDSLSMEMQNELAQNTNSFENREVSNNMGENVSAAVNMDMKREYENNFGYENDVSSDEEGDLIVDEDDDFDNGATSYESDKSSAHDSGAEHSGTSDSQIDATIPTRSFPIMNPIRSLENVVNKLARVHSESRGDDVAKEPSEGSDSDVNREPTTSQVPTTSPLNLMTSLHSEMENSTPRSVPAHPFPAAGMMGMSTMPFGMMPPYGVFPGMIGMPMMYPGMMPSSLNGSALQSDSWRMKKETSPSMTSPPSNPTNKSPTPTSMPLDLSGSKRKSPSSEAHSSGSEDEHDFSAKKRKLDNSPTFTPVRPSFTDALSKLAANAKNTDASFPSQNREGSAFTPIRSTLPRQPVAMPSMPMFPPFLPGMMGYGAMFNPYMMGAYPGSPATPSSSNQDSEVKSLLAEFAELVAKLGEDSSVYRAQQAFVNALKGVQSEREKALSSALASDPAHKDAILAYYNNHQLSLTRLAKSQLETERKVLELGGKLRAEPMSDRLLTVPFDNHTAEKRNSRSITPPQFSKPLQTSSPYGLLTPHSGYSIPHANRSSAFSSPHAADSTLSNSMHSIPSPSQSKYPTPLAMKSLNLPFQRSSPLGKYSPDGANTSAESGFLDASDNSPPDSNHSKRRFLSNGAVDVLTEWYDAHREHPYPDDEQIEQLAKAGNITECQKYLEAAGFLQNVIYINIALTEDEKILRYNTLSSLYAQLHMKRKSGFFKRIAAMQCVSPSNPRPGWIQCYYLLLQALDGYNISLDPKHVSNNNRIGWPVAQLRVLHELIYSARKMGNPAIAIRHITYLFHVMFEQLSESDRLELVKILESYTTHCEGGSQTLALENGYILPPVPFHRFPTFTMFKLECPAEKECVHKIKKTSSLPIPHGSPFIYSPIQMSPQKNLTQSRVDFVWQEGEPCYITVEASNPINIELIVQNLILVTEGVTCTANPSTATIAALSRHSFVLQTTPTEPGLLKILGYQSTVLGCRSNCRFREMPDFDLYQYEVKVVPKLPRFTLTLKSENRLVEVTRVDEDGVVHAHMTLYSGQSCECCVLLQNSTELAVEQIQVTSLAQTDQSLLDKVLKWNGSNLSAQLPVRAGGEAVLVLYMNGALPAGHHSNKVLSSTLLIEYSGGAGLEEDYCRHCSIHLSISLQPALIVKHTRVLPSFSVDTCYLELEVLNASHYTMSISSTALKQDSSLASQYSNTLKLCVPRCKQVLSNHSGHHSSGESESVLQSSVHSSQSADSIKNLNSLTNQIAEHMRNFVDVRWKLLGTKVEGKLELYDLPWKEIDVEGLLKPPVSICVRVNGSTYTESDDIIMTLLCEPVHVTCSLTNVSDCDMCDVVCCLTCDDEPTHSICTFLAQPRAYAKSLKASETLHLKTYIQFFCEGLYSIRLNCYSGAKDSTENGEGQILVFVPDIKIHVAEEDDI